MFLIACLTDHCCQLLIRCKNYVIQTTCQQQRDLGELGVAEEVLLRQRLGQTLGYGDLGRHALGKVGFHLVQLTVWFTQVSTCISYFIFIGNTLFAMFPMEVLPYMIRNDTVINQSDMVVDLGSRVNQGLGVPLLSIDNVAKLSCDRDLGYQCQEQSSVEHRSLFANFTEDTIPWSAFTTAIATSLPSNMTEVTSQPATSTETTVTQTAATSVSTSAVTETTASLSPTSMSPSVTMVTEVPHNATTTHSVNDSTLQPSPAYYEVSTSPVLALVILFPLPFFLLTSLIRKVRYIGPFSTIATATLFLGACAILIFIIARKC